MKNYKKFKETKIYKNSIIGIICAVCLFVIIVVWDLIFSHEKKIEPVNQKQPAAEQKEEKKEAAPVASPSYVPPEKIREKLEMAKKNPDELLKMLKSPSKMEAGAAAEELILKGDEMLPKMYEALKNPGDLQEAMRLIESIGEIGSKKAFEVLKEYYQACKVSKFMAVSVLYKMANFQFPETAEFLKDSMKDIKDEDVLFSAIRSMGMVSGKESASVVEQYLTGENVKTQGAAMLALARMGAEQNLAPKAVELLNNASNDEAKIAAILTLGLTGNDEQKKLVESYDSKGIYFLNMAKEEALKYFEYRQANDPEKINVLNNAIEKGSWKIREWALMELYKHPLEKTKPVFEKILKYQAPGLYIKVVNGLRTRGVELVRDGEGYRVK